MQDFRKIYQFRSFSVRKWLQIIRIMTNLNLEKWDHWSTVFTFVNVRLSTNNLWVVLKPVVHKFHGNTENYYSNFCGLLQENILPKKWRHYPNKYFLTVIVIRYRNFKNTYLSFLEILQPGIAQFSPGIS